MAWNLHIVGQRDLAEVGDIAAAIVKDIEAAGHTLVSAVLTTDLGPQDITVTPAPPEPPATIAGEPVAETGGPAPVDTQSEAAPAEVSVDTPPQ